MHASKYNYYVQDKDGLIAFNGFTKKWVILSTPTMAEAFRKVLDAPDMYFTDMNSNNMLQQLKCAGFVVEDNYDEQQHIYDAYQEYKHANKVNLCILPTYTCNLDCWYCVQKHETKFMKEHTKKKIKTLIKSLLAKSHRDSLTLSWFGGEPLLCPDTILDISTYAKQLCQKDHTEFVNSITTNGTLIDDAMIEMFESVDLKFYQITVDGTMEYHNKTKRSPNIRNTYETTCSNIKKLLDNIAGCDITLRYNYTPQNLSVQVALDLAKTFEEPYRKKLEFLPRPVWQNDSATINQATLNDLVQKMKDSGFKVNQTIDLQCPICYTESDYFLTIFYDGSVDKCGNLAPPKAKGRLLDNGEIEWNNSLEETYGSIWKGHTVCTECRYLPLCMGLCPVRRRRFIEKNEPLKCFTEEPDKHFETLILDYVNSFKK